MEVVRNKCHFLFFEDNKLLKATFFMLASYLILEEVYICFVSKPTLTSSSRRNLKPEDFPEIILCPKPSIDIEAAKLRGYDGIEDYYLGVQYHDHNGSGYVKPTGWSGNNHSENVQMVSKEISPLKSTLDCPERGFVLSRKKGNIKYIKYHLTKALYPYHICCKVTLPMTSVAYHGIRI